jgi:transcriptional regulator with XRE-family HTH domain
MAASGASGSEVDASTTYGAPGSGLPRPGAPGPGSLLARRQLGHRLRLLRKAAGKTLGDVETAGVGSVSKLYRMESGQVSVRPGDVRELCVLYGTPDEALEGLLALARASKVGSWQEDYADVLLPGFGLYVDLEATATTLQTYDAELIHGLLQTPDYTRAVIEAEFEFTEAEQARQLEARLARQSAALDRDPPLRVTQILGQAALSRVVGSPEIMAAQVEHVRQLDRRENVEIRILPWESGAHRALAGGAFTIMSYAEAADPDFVYMESLTGARYLEEEPQLRAYRWLWDRLARKSVPLEEFRR